MTTRTRARAFVVAAAATGLVAGAALSPAAHASPRAGDLIFFDTTVVSSATAMSTAPKLREQLIDLVNAP